jgi:hypothetical protein
MPPKNGRPRPLGARWLRIGSMAANKLKTHDLFGKPVPFSSFCSSRCGGKARERHGYRRDPRALATRAGLDRRFWDKAHCGGQVCG